MGSFRNIGTFVSDTYEVKDRLHISTLGQGGNGGKHVPGVVPDDFCLIHKIFYICGFSL